MSYYIYGENCVSEYPNVSISIERITPDIAEKMLERNVKNRNESKHTIDKYAKDMRNGNWVFTGSTIVFNGCGDLEDGQHRLQACVKSGVPFDSVVIRGVKANAQDMMDNGRKRTNSDVLAIKGEKNSKILASAANALVTIREFGVEEAFQEHGNYKTTKAEVLKEATSNEDLKRCVGRCIGKKNIPYPTSSMSVLYYLFSQVSREDADFFLDDFGSNAPTRQPIQVLKNTLLSDKANNKTKLGKKIKAAYVIKTWNAFRNGEELRWLRWTRGGSHPEPFPLIDGLDETTWGGKSDMEVFE